MENLFLTAEIPESANNDNFDLSKYNVNVHLSAQDINHSDIGKNNILIKRIILSKEKFDIFYNLPENIVLIFYVQKTENLETYKILDINNDDYFDAIKLTFRGTRKTEIIEENPFEEERKVYFFVKDKDYLLYATDDYTFDKLSRDLTNKYYSNEEIIKNRNKNELRQKSFGLKIIKNNQKISKNTYDHLKKIENEGITFMFP